MSARRTRGFTLVELMIVVAIIGVLASLAIYGVARYMAAAKSAEAKDAVGGIARAAVAAFEQERGKGELADEGSDGGQMSNVLCASAIPVPANIAQIKGIKYQPQTALGQDFNSGDVVTGWSCLKYTKSAPTSYQHSYLANGGAYVSPALGGPDPTGTGFEAAAQGDLDGDGQLSTFARSARLDTDHLTLATQIFVDEELE